MMTEMTFWKEWSGVRQADASIERCDEDLWMSREALAASTDQVDRQQFLTWEDLVGQR